MTTVSPITCTVLSDPTHIQQLQSVFESVFTDSAPGKHTSVASTSARDAHLCVIGALNDSEVIGGLVGYEFTLLSGVKELYLYDIAVLPAYQKQGIGTKLIETLREACSKRGISTIFVDAEADDDGAVAFYRSLTDEELSVRHFTIPV
jgi:aminoglycoside 3-N-acetyltransferase I